MNQREVFYSSVLKDYLTEIMGSYCRENYRNLPTDFVSPTFIVTPGDIRGVRLHHVKRFNPVFDDCGEWTRPPRNILYCQQFNDIADPKRVSQNTESKHLNETVLFYTGLENLVTMLSAHVWPRLFSTTTEDLTNLIGDMVKESEAGNSRLTLSVNQPIKSFEGAKKKLKTYFAHVFRLNQKAGFFESDDFKVFEKTIAIYHDVLRFSDRQDLNYRHPQVPGLNEVLDKLVAWNPEQEPGTQVEFGVTFTKQINLPNQPYIPDLRFHLFGLRITNDVTGEVLDDSPLLKDVSKSLPEHARKRLFVKNEALLGSTSIESATAIFAHLMRKSLFTDKKAYVDLNEQLEVFKVYFLECDGAQSTITVKRQKGENAISLRLELHGKHLNHTRQPRAWEFVQSWKLVRS